MKLRHFLDSAFVLLVEESQRIGTDLFSSLDQLAKWRAGYQEADEDKGIPANSGSETQQNEAALAALTSMMAGAKRG